ncbi:hypothetical protein BJX70DRAFT_376482 [Aspergillus crustosus]
MPRPDLPGESVKEYEEIWRKLSFREGAERLSSRVSFVLESGPDGLAEGEEREVTRTFIGAIWGTYIVLRQKQVLVRSAKGKVTIKSGGEVSARREDWDQHSGFEVKYLLGPEAAGLPARSDIDSVASDAHPQPGGGLKIRGEGFVVRSFEMAED